MTFIILLLAALLAAVTLAPLSGTHHWWVRMWDFPRIQIAIAQAVVIVLALAFLSGWLRWAVAAGMLACLLPHLLRIRPFTPLHSKEMRFAVSRPDGAEVTVLAANVLMENDRHDLVRGLIERVDPDVLLLMETDQTWLDGVRPALSGYPTVLAVPKDNYYGLIFATRLPVEKAEVVFLTGDARFAHRTDVPMVVMGDFNDAAWSPTSRLFKHYGRYLDPRIGRGLYASFHAKNWLIRCAIDQLFLTEEVAVVDFRLGEKTGSDHFPVLARVRIDPEEGKRLNAAPKPITPEEREEIDRRLEDYRRTLHPVAGPSV
jgi:endonuclease/exonuclease/phosphatase (EEP) superfamily protein YafD